MDDKEMEKPEPSAAPPYLLGLAGLALALGGWKLSAWTPPREGDALFADVRGMAGEDALGERMDEIKRRARPRPPLEMPGRLAFFFGTGLFVLALARMARAPVPKEEAEPVS
ncbi:MAG: hypothetical protein K2W96_10650 [Gemmataceae bacterium]|nr:hypothetical protein [Gemmataceae bacterium]